MLTRIICHEWKNLRADRTIWTVAMLFALLIGYGLYNGIAWFELQQQTNGEIIHDEEIQFAERAIQLRNYEALKATFQPTTDPSNPIVVGQAGRTSVLPPAPLAFLSVGQGDLLPANTGVSIRSRQRIASDKYGFENPLNLLAGRFDLSFVIVYLYPLLILALSYNLISAEREGGMLAMLLAQPVRLREFVFGKLILRAGVVFVLVVGLTLVGILLSRTDLQAEGALPRLLLWIATVIIYGAFWFTVAVAVNASGKTSATNAVALVGIWLVLLIAVPALLNVFVTAIYPVPSRMELLAAVRENAVDWRRDGKRIAAQWYDDHPEMRHAGADPDRPDQAVTTTIVELDKDNRTAPVEQRFDEQLARQQGFVNRFRFLSPAIVTHEALNDIAGTGVARHRYFRLQVERYRDEWKAYFTPKIFRQVKMTMTDYDAIPRFAWSEEPINSVTKRVLIGLVGVTALMVLIGLLGIKALRSYPIAS